MRKNGGIENPLQTLADTNDQIEKEFQKIRNQKALLSI
jgi:hypothetical protein